MNVEILSTLVGRQKQINAELDGIKAKVAEHEAAIEALYAQGQPLADEARSISNELKIELGLTERKPAQPVAA